VNSTGTANASLTLALTGTIDDTFDDFYYPGTDGEYLVIYTDGREVDFQSIKFGSSNSATYTSLTVFAYRDDNLLGSQTFGPVGANFPNDFSTEAITFTSSIFDNADEIRLIGVDGVNVDVVNTVVDDLVIADAIADPTITSATYNASTNTLVVTGINMLATGGAINDIDVSKLTLTGEGGATYTLTSSNVEIDSATQFTVSLNATDQINVEGLLNRNGTSAVDATTFNLAAAADWNPAQTGHADLTGNGVTVSNVQTPTITSATYNASTGVLVVTGTNLVKASGAVNDITANKLTLTGEGGETYTLTDTANVEITDSTSFSLTLSATDKAAINQIINKNGTSSTSGTTYNLAAADDWNTVIGNTDIADGTGNGITVSNVAAPAITSAAYDYSTNTLTVTGTGFLKNSGAANDIDVSKLTFTGESGATYTLTSASDVEITSATAFSVTLSGTDLTNVEALLNKDGITSATSGTTYNLAATEDWATGADSAVNVTDTTGNGITVSNYSVPTITSATYDVSTGQLVITGTNFVNQSGATNDIDTSLFTFTGEGGNTYTLTNTSDVEITSATVATVTLSTTDLLNVNGLLNKNGTSSVGATTYNLAAADDWMPGAPSVNTIADLTGNGITVSNVQTPTITSTTYNANTGSLTVTGTNLIKAVGATNDIDASTLTFTGEGGTTYTLTDTGDVEITSATAFTVTLSSTDKAAINQILNKNGTSSVGGTTFNLAAADDWNTVIGNADISDATNTITVSNVAAPTITSTTYNYSTNTLVVTGNGFLKLSGAVNDIDVSKLTFTGEGGATYTLTSASDVEIDSDIQFTVTLSGADLINVETLLNKDGAISADATTYNLAAAEDWAAGADSAVNVADTTGNGITVSNYSAPTLTSATYDVSTGQLVITGDNFVGLAGAANDLDASLLTFTGDGGSYTLTDTGDIDITSATAATVTLSATDQLNVHGLLNKNGTSSGGAVTYNLAAADNWITGAPAATDIADTTGNGITTSNVASPTISSATYDSDTGILQVTGTNLFKKIGASNDIDISTLTFTGGVANATYTLTSASDVEITSATSFSVTLSGADKTNVDALLDQLGTVSSGGSTYNLAAADDWLAAADAAANIADTTAAITVSINPKITSATYNAVTGVLVVTGTNIQANGGGADIDVSTLTFTGEGGATYTLTDSSDVERDSTTQFTVTLSATDKAAINQVVNKNGTASTGGTTYNLAAADDWNTNVTSGDTSDSIGNGITVSNVTSPAITSATYDASTGTLAVTGVNFLALSGATNDIVADKFTIVGEGGETYTLTDTADVDITSATAFTLILSATDLAAVNRIINKNGTTSTGGATYNLTAAEDWAAGADVAVNVADETGNGITANNVAVPTITAATYNAGTGVLVVTGTGLLSLTGANNDIDASLFTFTGLGGSTYTLTDTADVDITSATEFTINLSVADKTAVNALLDANGTIASDTTTYNLAAAEDWAAGADAAVTVADITGNGITASNASVPTITSAAYNAATGELIVTGTDFISAIGASNDIVASKFTFAGEGGETYTLTNTANVEITSGTAFTLTLSATDKASVNQIVNKNGTVSTGGATYNLAAAEDWAAGANVAVNVADTSGNVITASNVAVPAITSATYNAGTGALSVTGTNFLKASGATNDIVASKFTITGKGGATYTLTSTANVEITSATAFTLTLSVTDKAAVNQLVNKNGTASSDATVYNLAAAEDWAAGVDVAVSIVDATGNGITATIPTAASGGGGGSGGNTGVTTKTVDGVNISTRTEADGSRTLTVPVIDSARTEEPGTFSSRHADIPILTHNDGTSILSVSLPVGVGFVANGRSGPARAPSAASDLVQRIERGMLNDNNAASQMTIHGQNFIASLPQTALISVQTITLTPGGSQNPGLPVIINGSNLPGGGAQALIINAADMPSGTVIQLNNIAFAAIIGATRVTGGAGANFAAGNGQNQYIVLGAEDDILFGGGGDDTIGSLGGDDQIAGDAGDDVVFGGTGDDSLSGGAGSDVLNGGLGFDAATQADQLSDYQLRINGDHITLTNVDGDVDKLTDIELIQFESGESLAIAYSEDEAVAHHLVKTWLDRDLSPEEGNAMQNWTGTDVDLIVEAFLRLPEAADFRQMTAEALLAGLNDNPAIILLSAGRNIIGNDDNNQGYLPLGLALNVDGRDGYDVLRMQGAREDVHVELVNDALEMTHLEDGAMLSLTNAEMIAFDSGENILLAHNRVEGILGRLFQTFFDRDATIEEWQLGHEALAGNINPDVILDWFQARASLGAFSDAEYIQALYTHTLGRTATETELQAQLFRLENNAITRNWLAVDLASSDEAITTIGSVLLLDGGL
jgi:predicted transcriptional regulator